MPKKRVEHGKKQRTAQDWAQIVKERAQTYDKLATTSATEAKLQEAYDALCEAIRATFQAACHENDPSGSWGVGSQGKGNTMPKKNVGFKVGQFPDDPYMRPPDWPPRYQVGVDAPWDVVKKKLQDRNPELVDEVGTTCIVIMDLSPKEEKRLLQREYIRLTLNGLKIEGELP